MNAADLAHRFAFHPAATQWKADGHQAVRDSCHRLAEELNVRLPEGREKDLAITHLEEVMFWGNAALAREADHA